MSAKKFFKKLLRYTLCLAAGLAAFAACGYTDYRLWPLDLPASAHPRVPMTAVANQQLVLPFTPGVPVAEVASFNDQQESHTFDVAYDLPTEQKLETINSSRMLPALAQFLIFKSQTDNRVVDGSQDAPRPLTREQATELASDILDVAHFYDLPLDYFMGVGAMENDYMDVNGDLTHAVWKKRAQRGDIVLRRTRKRVMVSDYAMGIWQITRETLRAAHQLYLHDKRDYSQLPARLRPPRQLDLNNVNDAVLTTYAGLLLRDLLDHFGGDVEKAIGAYNGGVRTPNPDYASGVKNVADYARRILEHASAQDDPNTNAKSADKPQPTTPCLSPSPAPPNAPGTNNCATPGARNLSADDAQNPSPQPKPPYRRDD